MTKSISPKFTDKANGSAVMIVTLRENKQQDSKRKAFTVQINHDVMGQVSFGLTGTKMSDQNFSASIVIAREGAEINFDESINNVAKVKEAVWSVLAENGFIKNPKPTTAAPAVTQPSSLTSSAPS